MLEMKLELVPVPVSDVDRAIEFYQKVGFNLDQDHRVSDAIRFVQLTPPGSACSICMGPGVTDDMVAGTQKGLQMVVKNAQQAHDTLAERGIDVSDVQAFDWGKFVYFSDPDGNSWAIQELPPRD